MQVASSQVINWLGVTNLNLAVSIMQDQGIQGVTLDPSNNYVQFEHVWVEAYLPYGNYRGAGSDAASLTCSTSSDCHWVALDPAFKQKTYNSPSIDVYNGLSFDYTSYYNAIKNSDQARKDKNPLEIYENQVLAYLGTNYPGKTLKDVEYAGAITPEQTLILPASLPYTVVGAPRRLQYRRRPRRGGAGDRARNGAGHCPPVQHDHYDLRRRASHLSGGCRARDTARVSGHPAAYHDDGNRRGHPQRGRSPGEGRR